MKWTLLYLLALVKLFFTIIFLSRWVLPEPGWLSFIDFYFVVTFYLWPLFEPLLGVIGIAFLLYKREDRKWSRVWLFLILALSWLSYMSCLLYIMAHAGPA